MQRVARTRSMLGQSDEPVVARHARPPQQLLGGGSSCPARRRVAGYFVVGGRQQAGARHARGRRGVHDHDVPPAVLRARGRAEARASRTGSPVDYACRPPPPRASEGEADTTEFDVPPPPRRR